MIGRQMYDIKCVSRSRLRKIIKHGNPRGLFIVVNQKSKKKLYTAIDSIEEWVVVTHEANSLSEAVKWLKSSWSKRTEDLNKCL
jgi:hypothetical protein